MSIATWFASQAAKRVDDANARPPSTPPPRRRDLSTHQLKMFTMGGAAGISDYYFNEVVVDTNVFETKPNFKGVVYYIVVCSPEI